MNGGGGHEEPYEDPPPVDAPHGPRKVAPAAWTGEPLGRIYPRSCPQTRASLKRKEMLDFSSVLSPTPLANHVWPHGLVTFGGAECLRHVSGCLMAAGSTPPS
ncbi:hypothetical protein D4764_18G0009840 [Takifugu flavidus]|uniref:Uncharacterized protein n=1 Tax=Takifugu flavidus TaxID=433684 RepID=A0A5C6NTP2_9TELE|nr:hypothetical protein D4764_18G0009840 [Takifugu flavidus]